MKHTFSFKNIALLLAVAVAASCTTAKDILYFQNIDEVKPVKIEAKYEPVIHKDDKLQIIISGPDKTVVTPYNFTLSDNVAGGMQTMQSVVPYLVDSNGDIDMPGLGRIHVEGMRRTDLVDYISNTLKDQGLVKDPVVSVSFLNYKVTILGEVRSPGTYTVGSERITVLQALGMAGDLLITAERSDIILIRDVDGEQTHIKIDLTDGNLLNSPYFYIHQNDVLYVPQSPARIAQGTTATSLWSTVLSSITTMIAVLSLVLNVTH